MPGYSAAFRSAPIMSNASAPICDIRTSATDAPRIISIYGSVINPGGFALTLGVGRPATLGTAVANAITFVPHDDNTPDCNVSVGNEWTTLPTIPTRYLRRVVCSIPLAVSYFMFSFPNGISISPSSSFAVWINSTAGTVTLPIMLEINVELDA